MRPLNLFLLTTADITFSSILANASDLGYYDDLYSEYPEFDSFFNEYLSNPLINTNHGDHNNEGYIHSVYCPSAYSPTGFARNYFGNNYDHYPWNADGNVTTPGYSEIPYGNSSGPTDFDDTIASYYSKYGYGNYPQTVGSHQIPFFAYSIPHPARQEPGKPEYHPKEMVSTPLSQPETEAPSTTDENLAGLGWDLTAIWEVSKTMRSRSLNFQPPKDNSISFEAAVFCSRGRRGNGGGRLWGSAENNTMFVRATPKNLIFFKLGENEEFPTWQFKGNLKVFKSKRPKSWTASISLGRPTGIDIMKDNPLEFYVLREGTREVIPLIGMKLENSDRLIIVPKGHQERLLPKLTRILKKTTELTKIKGDLNKIVKKDWDTLIAIVSVRTGADNTKIAPRRKENKAVIELKAKTDWRIFKDLQIYSRRFKHANSAFSFKFAVIASRKNNTFGTMYLVGGTSDNLFLQATKDSVTLYQLDKDANLPGIVSDDKICGPNNEYSTAWAISLSKSGVFQRCGAGKDGDPNLSIMKKKPEELIPIDQNTTLNGGDIILVISNSIEGKILRRLLGILKKTRDTKKIKKMLRDIINKVQTLDTIVGIIGF